MEEYSLNDPVYRIKYKRLQQQKMRTGKNHESRLRFRLSDEAKLKYVTANFRDPSPLRTCDLTVLRAYTFIIMISFYFAFFFLRHRYLF